MSYGGGAKCAVCEKSVYHNDPKVSDSGKTWHASCFRCRECKECITLAKWAQLDGENFCKPCYKKVFMLRGKYSDVGGTAPVFAGSTTTAPAGGEGGAGESAAPAAPAAVAPAAAKAAPSPAPKPTGTPAPAGEVKFGGGAKCPVCTKSVYAAEPSVAADGNKFHAACFRCLECKTQLTMAKWCVRVAISCLERGSIQPVIKVWVIIASLFFLSFPTPPHTTHPLHSYSYAIGPSLRGRTTARCACE